MSLFRIDSVQEVNHNHCRAIAARRSDIADIVQTLKNILNRLCNCLFYRRGVSTRQLNRHYGG